MNLKKCKYFAMAAFLSLSMVSGYLNPIVPSFAQSQDQSAQSDFIMVNSSNFPDETFRTFIINKYLDSNSQKPLTKEIISSIVSMNLRPYEVREFTGGDGRITDLSGIEYFTALKSLDLQENTVEKLDLNNNKNLITVNCEGNHMKELHVDQCTKLVNIYCRDNNLTHIEFPPSVVFVESFNNDLESIDLSKLVNLEFIHLDHNNMKTVDFSHNTKLKLGDIGNYNSTGFVIRNNFIENFILPNVPGKTTNANGFYEQNLKPGYEKAKWYKDSNYTEEIGPKEDVPTNGQTIYARYIPNKYNVIFDANGGHGNMENQVFNFGEDENLRKNNFTKLGYKFSHWNTTTLDNGYKYEDEGEFLTEKYKHEGTGSIVRIYAIWNPIEYKIILNNSTENKELSVKYGQTINLPEAEKRDGKMFLGWSLNANGAISYKDKANLTNMTTEDGSSINLYPVYTDLPDQGQTKPGGSGESGSQEQTEQEKKEAKKLEAKKNLKEAFETYNQTNYTTKDWDNLSKAYNEGLSLIDTAENPDEICQSTKNQFSSIPSKETRVEKLRNKINGLVDVNGYKGKLDFSNIKQVVEEIKEIEDKLKLENLKGLVDDLDDENSKVEVVQGAQEYINTEKEKLIDLEKAENYVKKIGALPEISAVKSTDVEKYKNKVEEYGNLESNVKSYLGSNILSKLNELKSASENKKSQIDKLEELFKNYDKTQYTVENITKLDEIKNKYTAIIENSNDENPSEIENAKAELDNIEKIKPKPEPKPEPRPESKPEIKPEIKPEPKPNKVYRGSSSGGGKSVIKKSADKNPSEPKKKTDEKTEMAKEKAVIEKNNSYEPATERPNASKQFSDLPQNSWYYDSVSYCLEKNIFKGVSKNTFSPDENMSRAMMVQVLYNIRDDNKVLKPSSFKDVNKNDWYYNAVSWAFDNDIVKGEGGNIFAPKKSITRQEAFQIIYQYAKGEKSDLTKLDKFKDAKDVSPWAKEALSWALENNLLYGDNNFIRPNDDITRAEAAAIIMRFLENTK